MKYSFLFLMLIFSCGKSYNSDEFNRKDEVPDEAEEFQQNFRADLKSINPTLSRADGQVVIRLVEDDFRVIIGMRNVSKTVHPQRILAGQNCPGPEADTNGDGIISAAEATAVSSRNFLSLDGNLDDVGEDADSFPVGNILNAYNYDETTSRRNLRERLGTEFTLENRVVMIFGTLEDFTIPIACGELTRITGSE